MARRRSPQNKAHTAAPENKEPFTEEDQDVVNGEDEANEAAAANAPDDDDEQDDEQQDDMLTAFAEKDAQLRRLLKAENNEFNGVLGRRELRRVADNIRAELRGDQEVDMGGTDDGA